MKIREKKEGYEVFVSLCELWAADMAYRDDGDGEITWSIFQTFLTCMSRNLWAYQGDDWMLIMADKMEQAEGLDFDIDSIRQDLKNDDADLIVKKMGHLTDELLGLTEENKL
jgi:hypothetical protein